ncbi:hypothetical protein [Thioclava sp. GXIMD4215]|uniref:hypothetical protein n=1 Tax=Thioclava sp. GXIMD4215 TaxID=3131928 RepID=UPI003255590B
MKSLTLGLGVWLLVASATTIGIGLLPVDFTHHFDYFNSPGEAVVAILGVVALPGVIAAGITFTLAANRRPDVACILGTCGVSICLASISLGIGYSAYYHLTGDIPTPIAIILFLTFWLCLYAGFFFSPIMRLDDPAISAANWRRLISFVAICVVFFVLGLVSKDTPFELIHRAIAALGVNSLQPVEKSSIDIGAALTIAFGVETGLAWARRYEAEQGAAKAA